MDYKSRQSRGIKSPCEQSYTTQTMIHMAPDHTRPVNMTPSDATKKGGTENHKDKTDTRLEALLNDAPFQMTRPLMVSMVFLGLLHFSVKGNRLALISKIYATVILLALWSLFVRSFTLFRPVGFGLELLFKVQLHLWLFLCVSAATTTYFSCRKQNRFIDFLQRWSKLLKLNRPENQAFADVSSDSYLKSTRRSFRLSLICVWVSHLIACGLVWYVFFRETFFDILLGTMAPSHRYALLIKCILFVLYVYVCAAWLFTLCLFYNIINIINSEFRRFREDFKKAVGANGDIVGLKNYRRRHHEICLLVETADDILSGFTSVSIVVCLVNVMLILYNMAWFKDSYTKPDLTFTIANVFSLVTCLLYLVVIAVGGGYLNHLAHSPLKTMHNIQSKTATTEVSLQMIMFLSKLTRESIGITACGMFVIDRRTILTIDGAFITYFIVLVQFQQPTSPQKFVCNCTFV